MSLQQRPNITITENLISNPTATIPQSFTAGFLTAEKGEGNKDVIVSDQIDFINKFGYPTEYNRKAWFNIYEYLRYSDYCHVMRVVDTAWQNSVLEFGYNVDQLRKSSMLSNMYNSDIAFNSLQNFSFTGSTYRFGIFNREVTQNEDIAVSICTNSTDYDLPISTETVDCFEKFVEDLPDELTADMKINQLYILNSSGTFSVEKLDNLFEKDIVSIETDTVTGFTKITIDYDADLYNVGVFIYADLYFRNTLSKTVNNNKYGIDSVTEDASYTYIILDENLNLYNTTGNVVFYDKTSDWLTDNTVEGYLVEEEKYVTVTPGAAGYITYSDVEYDYVVNTDYTTATRIVYDNKIQNGSTIKTFFNMLNKNVDFTKNIVVFVHKKINGLFSLTEAFEVALERDASINAMYKRNYCEDVINQNSKLIYFKLNTASSLSTEIATCTTSITNCVLSDTGSTDYTNLNDYTKFETATNFYRSTTSISLKYIMGIELLNGTTYTMNLSADIAETRKDCIAVMSIWNEEDYLSNYSGMISTLLDEFGIKNNPTYLTIDSTHVIVYDNMKMIYDEFNEEFIWIPVIGDICGIYATEDNKGLVYSAGAGYQTTPIQNFLKMLITDNTDTELDSLSYQSINHIQKNDSDNNMYLYDILMYKDEDLITKRLNVRRMLNHFKWQLRNLLKPYFFQLNTPYLRSKVGKEINSIISSMLNQDVILGGGVICNDSNNTPDNINNNQLNISIYLQPTQVIRQILIEINIEKSDIILTESEL